MYAWCEHNYNDIPIQKVKPFSDWELPDKKKKKKKKKYTSTQHSNDEHPILFEL